MFNFQQSSPCREGRALKKRVKDQKDKIRIWKMNRFFQLSKRNKALFKVIQHQDYFEVKDKFKVSFAWLRDHCQSPQLYDSRTHQKKFEFPQITQLEEFQVLNNHLILVWKDGIQSKFCLETLEQIHLNKHQNNMIQPQLWNHKSFPYHSSIDFIHFMESSNHGLKKALENICIHGFCIVENCAKTSQGTKDVAERIGPIFNNMYGQVWEVTAKQQSNVSDTAYSNIRLEPHNDTTYFNPGMRYSLLKL